METSRAGLLQTPEEIEEERQEAQQEKQKALASEVDIFDLTTFDVMSEPDAFEMKDEEGEMNLKGVLKQTLNRSPSKL